MKRESEYDNDFFCPNGCTKYYISMYKEGVLVWMFKETEQRQRFWFNLYPNTWNNRNLDTIEDLERYIETVSYWKENNRYKDIIEKMKKDNADLEPRMENMGFDYDFNHCPICEEELDYDDYNRAKCSTGCIEFSVDPQGETVRAVIFNDKSFLVPLCKDSVAVRYKSGKINWNKYMLDYVVAVEYWKENNPYKNKEK